MAFKTQKHTVGAPSVTAAAPAPAVAPASSAMAAFYQCIAGAEDTSGGQFFLEGNYYVALRGIKWHNSQKRAGVMFLIIETQVIKSSNPDVKPGEMRSQMIDFSQQPAKNNAKNFFLAVARSLWEGAEAETRAGEERFIQECMEGDANGVSPAADLQLYLRAYLTPTKPKVTGGEPGEFTRHVWEPFAGQLD